MYKYKTNLIINNSESVSGICCNSYLQEISG